MLRVSTAMTDTMEALFDTTTQLLSGATAIDIEPELTGMFLTTVKAFASITDTVSLPVLPTNA